MSYRFKRKLTNSFGGIGYIMIIMQWLLVALLLVPPFISSDIYSDYLRPDPAVSVQDSATTEAISAGPSSLWLFIGLVIGLAFMLLSIGIIVKLPGSIARASRDITQKSASAIEPLVARSRKIKPTQHKKLATQIIKLVKLIAITAPLALTLVSHYIDGDIGFEAALFMASLLAIISTILFSLQYILADWLKVKARDLL